MTSVSFVMSRSCEEDMMKKSRRQNPIAVALRERHGKTATTMKDRREPRGGSRNKQRDYREERY